MARPPARDELPVDLAARARLWMTATVADGWLTLKGEVKHQLDSDAAFEAVSGLRGIGGITNEIKVISAGIDG